MKGKPRFKVIEVNEQLVFDLCYANLTLARILDEVVPGNNFATHAVNELARHKITNELAYRILDDTACQMFMERRAKETAEALEAIQLSRQLALSQRRRQRLKSAPALAMRVDRQGKVFQPPQPASFELSPLTVAKPASPSSEIPVEQSRPLPPRLLRRQRL